MPAFCRECLGQQTEQGRQCVACGAVRVIAHAELDRLAIAHIDCDAFFASVEKRDDPSLKDKPVIVGGGTRGVVATCCYVARQYGIRSAMPMFKALRLCPDVVVIPPNMRKYQEAGQLIRSMMDDLTPVVKAVSIDEAYLDMTGTGAVHGAYPAMALARFVQRVQREVGVTISVGLSYNPFLAKIASDLDKPNGFAVIGQAGVAEFLAPRSVGIIHGVGAVFQERLARDGISTIGDLQRLDPAELGRRYGDEGLKLARLSRGEDHRAVTPNGESKSISAETTFETDISDPETLEQTLIALGERVAQRLRKADYAGSTITLKLKTPDFKQVTRSRALTAPTQLGHRISALGRELLAKEPKGRKYRLIGIGVTDLGPSDAADRGDLLDVTAPKEAALERTLDRLRDRFGSQSVKRAVLMPKQRPQTPQSATAKPKHGK